MVTYETLANLDLFMELPQDALTAIAELSHKKSFKPGTAICSDGHLAKHIYLLMEGTVNLTVSPTSQPKPLTISVLKSQGQAFGWSAVIGSGYYTAAAKAMTDVTVIAIDGQALVAYLEENPAVGYDVMKQVAQVVSYRLATVRTLLMETVFDVGT